jgi:hypothetical protein
MQLESAKKAAFKLHFLCRKQKRVAQALQLELPSLLVRKCFLYSFSIE